ncbi:MAG: polysaccharide deacetylase family protein [Deltaproteobacteria bacterium]|nr:polysaccharide deacetylase family protein [Deltaproteobacteria bacterium]MDQ3299221.1 polysaccharide deacetylase family protein [Myxococcota bacterium]
MNARWLGWLAVAWIVANAPRSAHAEARKPAPAEPANPAKAAKPTKPTKPDKLTEAKPAKLSKADAELLALTNDPLLGKADRIHGEETKGLVTFTFDDGPNPETTPAVIDALVKYDVPATFFVVTRRLVGKQGEASRALLKRELASGFVVASHSVSHPSLRGASPKKLASEIDQSIRTLASEAERTIGLFRAPFGAIDAQGRAWLKKRGLTEAFWSIDTLDWQAKRPDRLRKKVLSMILAQDGGVVLMHDVKPITAEVIAGILDDLEAENCKRLGANRPPILPVSIHYFLRDNRKPRAIPETIRKRTEGYRLALPVRCATRPAPEPDPSEVWTSLLYMLWLAPTPAPATPAPAPRP